MSLAALPDDGAMAATVARPRTVRPRGFGTAGRGTVGISLGGTALILAAWELTTRFGLVQSLFLPAPHDVWAQLIAISTDGYANATLAQHLAASLMRIGSAALIATATAVPVANSGSTVHIRRRSVTVMAPSAAAALPTVARCGRGRAHRRPRRRGPARCPP